MTCKNIRFFFLSLDLQKPEGRLKTHKSGTERKFINLENDEQKNAVQRENGGASPFLHSRPNGICEKAETAKNTESRDLHLGWSSWKKARLDLVRILKID